MAKELTLDLKFAWQRLNSTLNTAMQSGTVQFDVTGTDYVRQTMSVPTSVTALPLGAITTPGYCLMVNRDATNYVEVYDSTGGNACLKLKPGEWAVFRFAGAAPAVKAHTAAVKIEYLLLAD